MNEESKSTPISLKLAGAALLLCISLMIPAMLPVESEGTSTAAAQADGKSIMTHPEVMLIQIDGTINPATAEYILNSISKAENEKVSALVIEMNTPGGLLESTRKIVQGILGSAVPIIVYIAPSGSRAGCAGVFITLSANVAAMAPGTNIGAADPVGGGISRTQLQLKRKRSLTMLPPSSGQLRRSGTETSRGRKKCSQAQHIEF